MSALHDVSMAALLDGRGDKDSFEYQMAELFMGVIEFPGHAVAFTISLAAATDVTTGNAVVYNGYGNGFGLYEVSSGERWLAAGLVIAPYARYGRGAAKGTMLGASEGSALLWHGKASAVARREAKGIFVDGPGNGGLYWATSKNMDELGPLGVNVGGNTNVRFSPPFLINKGGLEATYTLTAAESAVFKRAWGFDFNWNIFQWYKGATGQYYYREGIVTWGQRFGELGKGVAIGGAGIGGGVGTGYYLSN